MTKSSIKIIYILAIYWILAFVSSYLFSKYIPINIAQALYKGLNVFSYGIGPAFAALVMLVYSRIKQTPIQFYSFLGTGSKFKAILFFLIPIIAIRIVSKGDIWDSTLTAISILLYCLFEEIGWRGFLLSSLRNYNFYIRTSVTYVLWLVWHLSFMQISIGFAAFVFVGNFFINLSTRKTQSILVAATMHAVANILDYSPRAMIICIPVWVILFYFWGLEDKNDPNYKTLPFLDSI
jgi:uncharacterized protein